MKLENRIPKAARSMGVTEAEAKAALDEAARPKHTPLPWKFNQHDIGQRAGRITGRDSNHPKNDHIERTVAIICSYASKDENVANGQFVVRACNSHEELLRACEMAKGVLDTLLDLLPTLDLDSSFNNWSQEVHQKRFIVRSAIAKTKE